MAKQKEVVAPNITAAAAKSVGKKFAKAGNIAANAWRAVVTHCVTTLKGELPNAPAIKLIQDAYQEQAEEDGATWTEGYAKKARSECKQIVERYPLVNQALELLEQQGIFPDRHQIVDVARAIKKANEDAAKGASDYVEGKANKAKAIKSFAALAGMFAKKALDCNTPQEGSELRECYDAFWEHVEEYADVYGIEFE